jgi:hypothetical protein
LEDAFTRALKERHDAALRVEARLVEPRGESVRGDGNNVDIDAEMGRLEKNTLIYKVLRPDPRESAREHGGRHRRPLTERRIGFDEVLSATNISASGLSAEHLPMEVIANDFSTRTTQGRPLQRQDMVFAAVLKHQLRPAVRPPFNPAADGHVASLPTKASASAPHFLSSRAPRAVRPCTLP